MNIFLRFCARLVCCCAAAAFLCDSALAADPATEQEGKRQMVTLDYVKQHYASELAALKKCNDSDIFLSPKGMDKLRDLLNFIDTSLMPDSGSLSFPPDNDPKLDEIVQRYNRLNWLNRSMKSPLGRLLALIINYKMPLEYYKLLCATDYLNYTKENTEMIVGFDSAYGEYMKLLGEMERSRVCDVTGSELMMASGLDKYYSIGGYITGKFDRRLRAIGDYLIAIRPEKIDKLRFDAERLREFLDEAVNKLNAEIKDLEKRPLYSEVQPIVNAMLYVLNGADDLHINMVKLLDAVESGKGDLGKIRGNTLDANGAFHVNYAGKPGIPGYVRQARYAFNKCREDYKKAAARLNKEHGCSIEWK